MSEEKIEYKVSVPLFEKGELETFDNHIHEIVEEYSKLVLKEKEQILTQRIIIKQEEELKEKYKQIEILCNDIEEQDKEIERLNNKLKAIKSQLDYLETYSSKEDVFEDMRRRLDRIESIVNRK